MLERPFNDIDNLILSMLIYIDFYKIRTEIRCGNKMQLSRALEELLGSIRSRIHRIVPEYCVIGMLFELDVPYQIVMSSEKGINQHDAFSWQVEGEKFLLCDKLNPQAQYLNKILNKWIEEEDMEHREIFVKQVFDAMESTGANEIGEVTNGLNSIEDAIIEILYSGHKTKKVLHNLLKTILDSVKNINIVELLRKRESFLGMFMIALGMLLYILPGDGFQIIGTGLVFAVFVFAIIRLVHHYKVKSKFRNKNFYVSTAYFLGVLMLVLLAVHVNALKLSINIILGFSIFIYGIMKLKTNLKKRGELININAVKLSRIQTVTSIIAGLLILGIPYYSIEKYLNVIELYIIVLGLSEIIYEAFKGDSREK